MAADLIISVDIDASGTKDGANEATRNIKSLADNTASLTESLLAADLAGRGIAFLGDQIRQLGQDAIQTSLDVGQAVANASTIKDIDTSQVSDELYRLSTEIPQQVEQIGEGLYNIFSSVEASQKQALVLTELYAKGAVAARTNTETFGTAVSGVLNAYKMDLSEATQVSDVFFNTVKLGVVNGQELASNLGNVTQSAKNLGVDFNILGGLIAGVTKEGGNASENINNLSNLFQKLPVKQTTDELANLGISIKDNAGNFRPVLDVLTDLKAKLDKMPPAVRAAQLQEIFPDAQARTGLLTILSQLDFVKNAALENARAAGTTEEAYKKMSGTAAAQLTLLKNSVIAFLAKLSEWVTQSQILGGVLSGLGGTLQFFSRHTGEVLALVAALGLLVAAYNAVSIAAGISGAVQAIATLGGSLGGMVFVVQNVIRAMFGLQTAFIGFEATVAAVAGWAGLVIAVSAVVYALYQYNQAQKKTAEEHINGINAVNNQITALNEQKQTLASLQGDVGNLSDKQKTLADIYAVLDTASKNRVDKAFAEKGAVGALADEIERLNQAKKTELDARLTELAQKTFEAYQKQEEAAFRATDAENVYNAARINGLKDYVDEATGSVDTVEEQFARLRTRQIETAEASKIANKEFTDLKGALITGSQILGTTADKFVQNKEATRQLNQTTDAFRQTLSAATDGQSVFADKMGRTNNVIDDQAAKVKDLRTELQKLMTAASGTISQKVSDIAVAAKDKAEALKLAKEAKQNDSVLKDALKQNKELKEKQNAVEKELGLMSGGGGGGLTRTSRIDSNAAKRLADEQLRQFNMAMRRLDDGMQRLIEEYADKYRISRQLAFAQIFSESGFRTKIVSEQGAVGLTQVIPGTASLKQVLNRKVTAEELKDPKTALTAWGKLMTYLFNKYGDWELAILAYHQGEGTVDKLVKALKAGKSGEGIIGKKGQAYLEKIRTLSGVGGAQRFDYVETEEERNAKRILDLRQRITELQTNGLNDVKLKQELELAGVELEARETAEILKLRQQLNFEMTAPLPQTSADRAESLRVLQEFKRNVDQIAATTREINALIAGEGINRQIGTADVTSPEKAKQTAEQLNLLKSSLQNFAQMREQAGQQIAELAAEFDEGMTPLQKFDLQVKLLQESGKVTADVFENILRPVIEKTRAELEKAAKMEWAKKLRADARSVTQSLGEMAADFRQEIDVLTRADDIRPFAEFLDRIAQIKELKLEPGAFNEIRQMIVSTKGIDSEKFGEYVRQWLTLLSVFGQFDATKIDETVNKLTAAAKTFNQLTDAQRSQKRAEDFKNLKENLEGELEQLVLNGRELSTYEQTLRQLKTVYKDLDDPQKQYLLNLAAQIDAQNAFNKTVDFFEDSINTLAEKGLKGLFESWVQELKRFLIRAAAEWLASKFFKLMTGQSGGSGGFGGIFDSIKKLFGLGGGSGSGGGAGGNSAGANGGFGNIFDTIKKFFGLGGGGGGAAATANAHAAGNAPAGGGGGTGLAGTMAGIGAIASVVGGLIGGRVGNVISMAGMGMSIGAMFGPIGAGIGAAAGAIFGLFMGDPKRKRDKKEKLPQLQKGFSDALQQLRELGKNTDAFYNDPEGTIAKAVELRAQIASGFGIQFESKKYQKEAQKLIAAKLVEADAIIAELNKLKDRATLARDVDARLQPNFAGGVFMDKAFMSQFGEFKRRNGMLAGTFTGKDYLPSFLADGEMVINPLQINRVIQNAGGKDVFKNASIPNYSGGKYISPSSSVSTSTPVSASSASAPVINLNQPMTIILEGEGITDARIKKVMVDNIEKPDFQVKVYSSYEKGKTRSKGRG